MTPWKFVGAVAEGQQLIIGGVDVWTRRWQPKEQLVAAVEDPAYGRAYNFPVYEIGGDQGPVLFAAGEFSNCVWGFYVPEER